MFLVEWFVIEWYRRLQDRTHSLVSKVISYKVLLLHMLVFDEIQEWFLAYMLFMRFHDLGAEEAQRLTVVERTLHL